VYALLRLIPGGPTISANAKLAKKSQMSVCRPPVYEGEITCRLLKHLPRYVRRLPSTDRQNTGGSTTIPHCHPGILGKSFYYGHDRERPAIPFSDALYARFGVYIFYAPVLSRKLAHPRANEAAEIVLQAFRHRRRPLRIALGSSKQTATAVAQCFVSCRCYNRVGTEPLKIGGILRQTISCDRAENWSPGLPLTGRIARRGIGNFDEIRKFAIPNGI